MANISKPAGMAGERPHAPHHEAEARAGGAAVVRKAVGAAPSFDRAAGRMIGAHERSEGAEEPVRGMGSNPWVRHWAGRGPAPTAASAHAAHEEAAKPKSPTMRPAGRHREPPAKGKGGHDKH